MARESGIALEKATMNLYAGDRDILASFYSAIGWSVAARRIIHKHCEVLRERDSQEIQVGGKDLDVEVPSINTIKEV